MAKKSTRGQSRQDKSRQNEKKDRTKRAINQWSQIGKTAQYLGRVSVREVLSHTFEGNSHAVQSYSENSYLFMTSDAEVARQREERFAFEPKISVVVAAYETPQERLMAMIESLYVQTYSNWEVIIVDASETNGVFQIIRMIQKKYPNLPIVYEHSKEDRGIASTFNMGLNRVESDYVAFVDHDDVLEPGALYEIVKLLNEESEADFIYTDEDMVSEDLNIYQRPCFKPDYNEELLNTNNYIGRLFVVKRELIETIGAFREEFEGAQDYDFVLRATEQARKICHIPKVLYHKRLKNVSATSNPVGKVKSAEVAAKALMQHFERIGTPCEVKMKLEQGYFRPIYKADKFKQLLVIISGAYFEETKQITELRKFGVEIWHMPEENSGQKYVFDRKYILMIEKAAFLPSKSALEEMMGILQRPDVGAVGTKSVNAKGKVVQNGLVYFENGLVCPAFAGLKKNYKGYQGRGELTQYVSGINLYCAMLKKEAFEMTGGFLWELPHRYRAMDLCLQMKKAGYKLVQDPYVIVEMEEPEQYSTIEENRARLILKERWESELKSPDPYYNMNFEKGNARYIVRQR
ncbi:glycosyltransferase [Eubacterium oxidoreducens]|uniref:Glycosyl transferase family 2 n=1 Tax=Eubacterium oxidoreducens TaxID=1732 RepID=A0A1G6ADK7_EUBOX|nr:glycosyltransferase [Eubacterium oxidoreducens]SDB06406.1 Glycosyl transferase family 2 [Eubacterium oxidoreducens]